MGLLIAPLKKRIHIDLARESKLQDKPVSSQGKQQERPDVVLYFDKDTRFALEKRSDRQDEFRNGRGQRTRPCTAIPKGGTGVQRFGR